MSQQQTVRNPQQARVALMVEILHTYRARNLARARGDARAARRCHHQLTVLLDQLAADRARPDHGAPREHGSRAP